MNEVAKKMLAKSNNSRLEKFGKTITFCCMSLIVFVVALILIFVAQKGLSTFFVNKVNVFSFLFGSTWNPSGKEFGALPMILGSFIVTLLSALVATPFAIGAAVFMTEVSPKGSRLLQPAIELLVGIPSVVYGFIGLQVVVPFVRSIFGGTGFGLCPLCHDSPNSDLYDNRQLTGSPSSLPGSEYGYGSDSLANHLACHLKGSSLGYFYGSCLWDGACLRGSLGYSDGSRKLSSCSNIFNNSSFHLDLHFDHGYWKYCYGNS